MINRFTGVGRLTRDPDLRYTPNGIGVANFGIAINRPFTNKQGERDADFFNVVVWRKQAENVANYLKKGSLAGLDGRLQSRRYENNEGRKVTVVEVVAESVQFLDTRNATGGRNQSDNTNGGPKPHEGKQNNIEKQSVEDMHANNGQPIDISDDDLPF